MQRSNDRPAEGLCVAALRRPCLLCFGNAMPPWLPCPFPLLLRLQGGATRFDLLNLAVQPQKGKAVLFFPALSDGTSDPRHVAALSLPLPGGFLPS